MSSVCSLSGKATRYYSRISASSIHRTLCSRLRSYATEAGPSFAVHHDLKPSNYGQPLPPSHPHLMRPGELTPGIPAQEYERRRKALIDGLPDNSLVVCLAGQIKYMSGQIFYKFRQSSDFWYLTGYNEPGSAALFVKTPVTASNPRGYYYTLFASAPDPAKAKWDGARTSFDDVVQYFGADDARPIEEFHDVLRSAAAEADAVYVDTPSHSSAKRTRLSSKTLLKYLSPDSTSRSESEAALDTLNSSKRRPLAPLVGRLRAIKSPAEQAVMRSAADISARAHAKTMRFTEPGMSEHVVAAHFEYLCARDGSQRPAYVPVVASGANALIIHYTSNDQLIRPGELVLVDAGCEYNGYASDITRTYPASGTFTPAQRTLYSALLTAQRQLVALCTARAGLSLAQLHRASCEALRSELEKIGFNFAFGTSGAGKLESLLYPHFVGHPVGIDLHESSHFDRNEPLKPGMVITIEPGVYVPPSPEFPKEFHNIGIRIEDEVLVGEKDAICLSVNAPKEVEDIEGACQGLLGLEPF